MFTTQLIRLLSGQSLTLFGFSMVSSMLSGLMTLGAFVLLFRSLREAENLPGTWWEFAVLGSDLRVAADRDLLVGYSIGDRRQVARFRGRMHFRRVSAVRWVGGDDDHRRSRSWPPASAQVYNSNATDKASEPRVARIVRLVIVAATRGPPPPPQLGWRHMKVGLITHHNPNFTDGVSQVFERTAEALRRSHEIIHPHPAYWYASRARRRFMLTRFLASCEVLVGMLDDLVLEVRHQTNARVPYVCLLLGNMPRGAVNMIHTHHLLTTQDVLVGNCAGDIEIARKFFANAQIRCVHLPFNETNYYALDEASRQAVRTGLGLTSKDRLLLYVGRLTLEKNVHTLLKIFSIVHKIVPEAKLIVVGAEHDNPFAEFGVFSLGVLRMLQRVVEQLDLSDNAVRFIGHRGMPRLRELYGAADLLINMTLHHDENFGLAQVESMACGTPVVGSDWGGLKDTIVDGETGYKVTTLVTDAGTKVNWWKAVNRIVWLLRDDAERSRLRTSCRDSACDKYSGSRYRDALEAILTECRDRPGRDVEALQATAFGRDYWRTCAPAFRQDYASYQHGGRSYRLYKDLIAPYASSSSDDSARGLSPDQVLVLLAPLDLANDGFVEIDDPIYPLRAVIPTGHEDAAGAVVKAMTQECVMSVKRLSSLVSDPARLSDTIGWMIDAGLVAKSGPIAGSIPYWACNAMGKRLFSIDSIDYASDVVVVRRWQDHVGRAGI